MTRGEAVKAFFLKSVLPVAAAMLTKKLQFCGFYRP